MLNVHVRDNLNAVTRVVHQLTSPLGLPNSGTALTNVYNVNFPIVILPTDGDALVMTVGGYYGLGTNNKLVAGYINGQVVANNAQLGPVTIADQYYLLTSDIRRTGPTGVFITTTCSNPAFTYNYAYSDVSWAGIINLQVALLGTVTADLYINSVRVELKRAGSGV